MFPALRQNGIARWLAMILALYGIAAGMLLCLALSAGAARGRALGSRSERIEEAGPRPAESLATTGTRAPRSPSK